MRARLIGLIMLLPLMSCGLKLSREALGALEPPAGIRLHAQAQGCAAPIPALSGVPVIPLNGERISMLLWNVAKGARAGWREDLQRLSADRDLVLLQEAVLSPGITDAIGPPLHDFSPGYSTAAYVSGVWTAAAAPALSACSLQTLEPLLTTPKMALIVEYPLAGRADTLMVANIHAVNFSLGLGRFREQLWGVAAILKEHGGPVLFAGDFNTWSRARYELVLQVARELSLEAAPFDRDERMRAFGNPVDHVFFRGLTLLAAGSERVRTSDHNPILAELRLAPPAAHP